MNKPYIKFTKLTKTAIVPSKIAENSGFDIYADTERDIAINRHTTRMIPTGIASEIPVDWTFLLEERGSTGTKGMKRSAGVIDSNFRGEWQVVISNCTAKDIIISVDPERTRKRLLVYVTKKMQQRWGANFNPEIFDAERNVELNYIIYPANKAIAQALLVYTPHVDPEVVEFEELTTTDRGDGMLGSSGK